jgi:hypothetical protein
MAGDGQLLSPRARRLGQLRVQRAPFFLSTRVTPRGRTTSRGSLGVDEGASVGAETLARLVHRDRHRFSTG